MTAVTGAAVAPRGGGLPRMLALSMLTNPAAVVAVIAPAIVNALVQGGRFPLGAATLIGASELAGMTVALLLGPFYVLKARSARFVVACIAAAIGAHVLSLESESVVSVAIVRMVAGAAEGATYAIAIAALAATSVPDRAFGVMMTVNHVASSALLALVALFASRDARLAPVAMIISFLLLAASFAFAARPARSAQPVKTPVRPGGSYRGAGLGGIAGVFLLSAGFGAVWPLIGQVAAAQGLARDVIAQILSLAGIGGIVGGMVAAAIGVRFGRIPSLILASLGFAAALSGPAFTTHLAIIGFAILFFWTMSLPYYLGLASTFDTSGRLAVATSAMIPCGIAAGQASAGQATAQFGLMPIFVAGGGLVLAASIAMIVANDRHRRNQVALCS